MGLCPSDPYLVQEDKGFLANVHWRDNHLQGLGISPSTDKTYKISVITWHSRLGHINPKALARTLKLRKDVENNCTVCKRTNLTKRKVPRSEEFKRDLDVWEQLNMDVMYHNVGREGQKHTLVVIDTKSRALATRSLDNLSTDTVLAELISIMIHYQMQPKEIITDRASCFTSERFNNFMFSRGIKVTYCSPHKHEGNKFAERVIGTIRRKALSLMNFGRLKPKFICEAIQYATLLYNVIWH